MHDETNDTLERNIEQLVTRAHEPPRMDAEARARVLDNLKRERAARAQPRRARRWVVAAAAVAAVALAGIGVAALRGGGAPVAVYANFSAGPQLVQHGDQAELVLERGAVVRAVAARELVLVSGSVLVDVAPGGGEFRVFTPHGRVDVLGTRFALDATTDATSAAVVRGVVALTSEQGKVTLRAGELGVLREGEPPTRGPAPRLSHLVSWAKQARRRAEQPQTGPARRGTLLAREPEGWGRNREWPLPMRDLTVDVHVEDQVARVAVDQTFFNHVDRNLEGVYQFPLPHDAAISRLAMYVDGRRMESAIVERQRGRQIYESIVYRRRDPALLEWMKGNLFKVRIFPLPARSEKRIVLSYTQALARLYDGYRIEVPIPEVDEPVGKVRYRVRIADCGDCDVTSSSHDIRVARDGDDTTVEFAATQYAIGDDLLLHVRPPRRTAPRVAHHGQYWMVGAQPEIGGTSEYQRRSWVVLYDTSASRGPLELEAQAHVVDRLLQELDEEDEFAIVAFDATTRAMGQGFEQVARVDRRAVHEFLAGEANAGIGYTDLDAALGAALQRLEKAHAAPHVLYVGDGMATGGVRDLDALRARVRGKATVVAVAVGDRVDARVLRALSGDTGGLFATINPGEDLSWRTFDLVATLNTARVLDLSAAWLDGDGKPLAAPAYTGVRQLADGEEVVAVGRFDGARPAALRLAGVSGGEAWSRTISIETADADGGDAGYLPRLWAQRRIDALLSDSEADHQQEITKLGVNHFLITPFTSLLVLENDEMYEQYEVKRDRKPGWAHYELPDEIEAVHEPLNTHGTTEGVDPRALLLRTPVPLLYTPQSSGGGGIASDVIGISTFAQPIGGGWLGPIATRSSGTGWGFGRGGGGFGPTRAARVVGSNHRVTIDLSAQAESARASADAIDEPAFATVVTSGELREEAGRDWTVSTPAPGQFWSDRKGEESGVVFRATLGGLKKAKGKSGSRRRARRRYYGYGHGYGYAPQPRIYTHPSDPQLDDVSELVPGLFADDYDVGWLALHRSAASGSITPEAEALVAKARAALAPQRLSADGETMVLDDRGRFEVERRTETSTVERVIYDGEQLIRSYPELGLMVRRRVGQATPALYASWAPFVLPPAEHLARWYRVTVAGERTLALEREGDDEAPAIRFEVELDERHRVAAIRTIVDGERTGEVAIEYAPDRITLRSGDERQVLERAAGASEVGAPDVEDAVVVDMPLRQPAHWLAEAAGAVAGSDEWTHAQRQLLASYAALADAAQLRQTLDRLREHEKLRRGDLVLASRARRSIPAKTMRAIARELPNGDPVVRYLEAFEPLQRSGSVAGYAKLARDERGTLVGMLSSYRVLMSTITRRNAKRAGRAFEQFADTYAYSPLRYVAAHRLSQYYSWQSSSTVVDAWERLVDDPEWSYVARYEAARVLANRGKYAEAAERFDALLRDTFEAGEQPSIDYAVRTAFYNSGRGQAGWRLLWSQWRARVVRDGDPESLLSFLAAAQMVGEHNDVDRVVAPFRGKPIEDPDTALELADLLLGMGRYDQAWVFLEPLVDAGDEVDYGVLARASLIAEQQGRTKDAARYLETVLSGDDPIPLGELRAAYQRVIALYGKLAHSPGDEGADALAAALSAAADWRRHDPDNPAIDQLCASMLFAHGEPEQAWRYLSTSIERHPGLGSAYQQVATALENEGRLDEADELWQAAIEVEPTNPTWLLRRAQNMVALGQTDAAIELLEKVDRGHWQDRFSNVTWQAEHMRKQLRR